MTGWLRLLLSLVPLALLAGCGEPAIEVDDSAPSPALWEVTGEDGTKEAYLFGTIHALPDGVEWRTERLEHALSASEYLVVEIGELANSGDLASIFTELASTPGQPALTERVAPSERARLETLLARTGFDASDFASMETWAAALTLAQANSPGDPSNGVDRALLGQFDARLVLEGARAQLSIFDALPEKEQRDLLASVIDDGGIDPAEAYRRLVEIWLSGDMDALAKENSEGMLADPELRAALLTGRNAAWIRTLKQWIDRHGTLFVAVGAAHNAGEDGLPALLAAEGFTVRRIQ